MAIASGRQEGDPTMTDIIERRSAMAAQPIPRLKRLDSTIALLSDPYRFIGRNCVSLGSDVFATRLQLQPAICMTGSRAAEQFYDPQRFQREGAAPEPLQATLFGKGAVQGLDGARHRHRKAMFMLLRSAGRLEDLEALVERAWLHAQPDWSAAGRVVLYRALQPVLTRAVCDWVGVPVPGSQLVERSRQLTALFDAAASGVRRHFQARLCRRRAEAWLARFVEEARSGHVAPPAGSLARAFIEHREADGQLLPARIAAVELLNVLRPTVAVSVYISFVAHALHAQAGGEGAHGERLAAGDLRDAIAFVQEVRRHYPFFPAVVARVRESFDWNGMHFPQGRRTLLDIHGTNHDPRLWDEPDVFRPERWLRRQPSPFEFIPQGGGEASAGHRCPGEDVATRLMLLSLKMLVREMRYEVPAQNLSIAFQRLPAIPADGFIIDQVRRR
jgi:fatty-acid peroxygenase